MAYGGFKRSGLTYAIFGAARSRALSLNRIHACHNCLSSLRYGCVRAGNIEGADEISVTRRAVPWLAGNRSIEKRSAHCQWVSWSPVLNLCAQQQSRNPRDDGSGEATAAQERCPATRGCARDLLTGRQDRVRLICLSPVARFKRLPVGAESPHSEYRRDGRGYVEACTPVIPDGGNNKDSAVLAPLQCPLKHRLSRFSRCLFPAADVNDLGSLVYTLFYGPGQVELREKMFPVVSEDRCDQTEAPRCDARCGAVRLPKYQARDVSTVERHRALACGVLHEGVESPNVGASET